MALIKCPECGKEISDKAAACPGCGCPIRMQAMPKQAAPYRDRGGCLTVFLAFSMITQFFGVLLVPFQVAHLKEQFSNIPDWSVPFFIVCNLFILIGFFGVWFWKQWGAGLYLLFQVILIIYSAVYVSPLIALIALIWPALFVALVSQIWKEMDGAETSRLAPAGSGGRTQEDIDPKKFGSGYCVHCGAKREPNDKFCPNCRQDYDS